MTKITEAKIDRFSYGDISMRLRMSGNIVLTGSDLQRAMSGAATFKVSLLLWDDDLVSDDRIVRHWVTLQRDGIAPTNAVQSTFTLAWDALKAKETSGEGQIELYGELRLFRDDHDTGITAKTKVHNIAFPPGR